MLFEHKSRSRLRVLERPGHERSKSVVKDRIAQYQSSDFNIGSVHNYQHLDYEGIAHTSPATAK